jgi:riboflavin kinase
MPNYFFSGKVFSGTDEGKKFVAMKEYAAQMEEKLGFKPFLGTLNIRIHSSELLSARQLRAHNGIFLKGFSRGGRKFFPVKCFPCLVFNEGEEAYGAVVVPNKTRYGTDVLEIVSPFNLRKKLGLRNGNKVSVEVFA